jgi:hypothetical protein
LVTFPTKPEPPAAMGSARRLSGERITRFSVEEDLQPELSTIVATYVWASNIGDLDGVMETFHDATMVNDRLQES